MRVIKKEPGAEPEIIEIENELQALQDAVGGRIETVTFAEDCCLICNEDYRYDDSEFNVQALGIDFYGTVLMVGVDGEEFADLDERYLGTCLRILGGGSNVLM